MPTYKTGTAFTKPVDPILGQALGAWQAIRSEQPQFTDRHTGDLVDLLFATRARKVSSAYTDSTVIPMLCRKAGVSRRRRAWEHHQPSGPVHDRQPALQREGADDSVRTVSLARPLLAAVHSVHFYAKISPTALTRAYDDAGTSPVTSARSRSLSTATRSPPAPPRRAVECGGARSVLEKLGSKSVVPEAVRSR
ncbi:hypothetical protein OG241_04190 [Streptomyces sp. NBC_01390]|uniref:hypothetical protein n=1 Tax=Streptomyces sp. NBC_01390 TaxID=2903850 RepID=UPI003256171B